MHTKPISTKVIASYEATLTSGFAKLILNDGKLEFDGISGADSVQQQFCQAMIEALNGDLNVDGWQHIFQIFLNMKASEESGCVSESLKAEKNLSMAFQATVIYPFVLENFFFSDAAKEFLQRQIVQLFVGPTPEQKSKLADYYDAVDKRMETISQQNNGLDDSLSLSAKYNGIDMMGYVDAFEELRHGTFRAKVDNISNLPSGLRPLSSPSSSSPLPVDATASSANATPNPTPNCFQEAWKKIDQEMKEGKTYPYAHQYRHMQMDLLPVIYIIANMEEPKDEGQDMGETVVTSLFDDLSAAKLFYSMLSESKDKDDKSRSTTVAKDIAAILRTFKRTTRPEEGPTDDDLRKRPIFQFLRHNHHITHEYKALVHYSKLGTSPQEGANPVDVLAWFCKKFEVDPRSPIPDS